MFANSTLEAISIPASVSTIKEKVFSGCVKLKFVNIPENAKLKIIEDNVFEYFSIETLLIPVHLDQIGKECFKNAKKMANISVSVKNNRFSYVNSQALIYKCDDNFDILLVSSRSYKEITISSYVKQIN